MISDYHDIINNTYRRYYMSSIKNIVGSKVTIKAGARVRSEVAGITAATVIRTSPSTVTVKHAEKARDGKTRVYWKSNGYMVSSLI